MHGREVQIPSKRFGLIPATLTPMDENFKVDYGQLESYARWLMSYDIGGIAVNVDTGEGPQLYPEERVNVLKAFSEVVKGRVPIIAGLHARNTEEAVKLGLDAKYAGADCLLVFPHPAFAGEPNVSVVCNYHLKISEKVNLPLVLFQLQPSLGGVEFGPETLQELINIRSVVAIKEASFDAKKFVEVVRVVKKSTKRVTVLTGNDNLIYESLLLGAEGGLLGFGTIATDKQVEMFDLVAKGRLEEAREIWEELLTLEEVIFAPPVRDYRARLKEALVLMGVLEKPYVRPPLQPISEVERTRIRDVLKRLGLL